MTLKITYPLVIRFPHNGPIQITNAFSPQHFLIWRKYLTTDRNFEKGHELRIAVLPRCIFDVFIQAND